MSQDVRSSNDFTWTGSLAQADIRTVYERCQRLRLTGVLELWDGAQRQEVVWLGGQAVDQDLTDLLGWAAGQFRVTQRIPTAQGTLSSGIEHTGELRPGKVQGLYGLCADHRLSADVLLTRRNGETAQVRFTHGKVESATVNGEKGMALQALSTLSLWSDGTYCIRLRPLFGGETRLEAPIIIEKQTQKRDFDVTGAMPIPPLWDVERRSSQASQASGRTPAPDATPRAPKVEVLPQTPAPPATQPPSGTSIRSLAAQQAAEQQQRPSPPPAARSGEAVPMAAGQAPTRPIRKASPRRVWAVALIIGLCGGAVAFAAMGMLRGLWRGGQALRQPGPAAPAVAPPAPPAPQRAPDPVPDPPDPSMAPAAGPDEKEEAQQAPPAGHKRHHAGHAGGKTAEPEAQQGEEETPR